MTSDQSLKNNAMAKKMINASICAYQIHEKSWKASKGIQPIVIDKMEGPNGAYFYNVTPEFQDTAGFIDTAENGYRPLFTAGGKDYINAALVGAMADGNLVLSIRGTIPPSVTNHNIEAWVRDWFQDADMVPDDWPIQINNQTVKTQVEKGFSEAMNNLWPDIEKMIRQTIHDYGCTGVVITGHSKGAAMTFLAATLVQQNFPQFKNKIAVHAFAAPVAGNKAFQTAYATMQLDASTHRYQVANDLVPFLPMCPTALFYAGVQLPTIHEQEAWLVFSTAIAVLTDGGYFAVGDFTYFDSNHNYIPNAQIQDVPMSTVTASINAGKIGAIGDAHSAVNSYLKCFS